MTNFQKKNEVTIDSKMSICNDETHEKYELGVLNIVLKLKTVL